MREFFFYTGVVVWCIIGMMVLTVVGVALMELWSTTIRPSVGNLWFVCFGKALTCHRNHSYYRMWSGMGRTQYRYYTRGSGNKHFARCAMKRLIREARKESLAIGAISH